MRMKKGFGSLRKSAKPQQPKFAPLGQGHSTIISPFGNISHAAPKGAITWSHKNGGKFGNEI